MRALAALTLCVSTAAFAAPAPSSDSSQIVVQGTRDREKQIRDFVKDMTPAPIRGQLGRFELPVCPTVLGISDVQAQFVANRMRDVAKAAGIPVARPGCQTNIALMVTRDKARLLKFLEHWPGMFPHEWSGSTVQALERSPDPVAAWQTDEMLWDFGGRVAAGQRETAPDAQSLGGFYKFATATRLKPAVRYSFVKSVVVIQADALAGLTPTQLADYAAMRAFVRTDPKKIRPTASGTILNVIDAPMGSAVPITLTEWDFTFLKSFYSSTKNMYAEYQRAQMKGIMKRELDREDAERQ